MTYPKQIVDRRVKLQIEHNKVPLGTIANKVFVAERLSLKSESINIFGDELFWKQIAIIDTEFEINECPCFHFIHLKLYHLLISFTFIKIFTPI